ISRTNAQKASLATSVKGPQRPRSCPPAPPRIAAAKTRQPARSLRPRDRRVMTPSLRASDPGSKRTKTAGASSLMLATADTEDVAVRMADVHLPHAPWLVGRRPGHLEALREAPLVDGVHVVHPDRHPDALVRGIVAVGSSRFRERAPPPASLRVQ